MKILLFNCGPFASTMGGATRMKNLFLGRGLDITWADPVYYENYVEELEPAKAKGVRVVPGFKSTPNRLAEWLQREKHFLKVAKENPCDAAIFCNAWGTRRARKWLKRKGVPVVMDYSDLMHAFHSGFKRVLLGKAYGEALKEADLVVTTARALEEEAHKFNSNVRLISNGVKRSFYAKAKKKRLKHPNAGFVGAFGEWVELEKIVEAARLLPKTFFYLVGDGPKKIGDAPKNVVLTGRVTHAEARDYAAGFNVGLIPFAKNELTDAVCPIKLFEYWALGKPVVASHVNEVKRIAGNAVLYASTPEDWAHTIDEVLKDKKLARLLGQEGRKTVREYDWRALGKQYVEELEGLVAK